MSTIAAFSRPHINLAHARRGQVQVICSLSPTFANTHSFAEYSSLALYIILAVQFLVHFRIVSCLLLDGCMDNMLAPIEAHLSEMSRTPYIFY